jgi:hypothetical protein
VERREDNPGNETDASTRVAERACSACVDRQAVRVPFAATAEATAWRLLDSD